MPPSTVSVETDPSAGGVIRLILRGRVTVVDVAELHRAAMQVADGGAAVTVDCTQATHLDAAVVQLILALGRAVEGGGRACVVMTGRTGPLFRSAGLGGIISE